MPYAPGIDYRGDQYIYQGISGGLRSLGGSIEDWKKQHDETQQKLETADLLKSYADKRGFTTPEFQAKYAAANAEQKSKMAAGLSQTIVLQAHDAEQKAEQDFRQQQLTQQATIAANTLAKQMEIAQMQYGNQDAEPTQVTNPKDPSDVWGVMKGRTFIPNPNSKTKPEGVMFHQPGDFVLGPDGKPIGQYQGIHGENIKYFDEGDPFKKAAAKAMEEYNATKAQQTDTSFATAHPIVNALIFGRQGSLANPTPSPMPSAVPSPTYPPVAPQGATVSPAPSPSLTPGPVMTPGPVVAPVVAAAPGQQNLQALAQQALNDPNATPEIKAAARKILGQ